jgi:MYXO-CTERM domain-containing protein
MIARRRTRIVVATLGLLVLATCTVNGPGPRAPAPQQSDPDRMPSEVLDRQDPGADTSKNPVLSRSSTGPSFLSNLFGGCGGATRSSQEETFIGCGSCASGEPSGLVVMLAAFAMTLRRRRRSTTGYDPRQCQRERRPFVEVRRDRDRTAVRANNLAGNIEPEPQAAAIMGSPVANEVGASGERLE